MTLHMLLVVARHESISALLTFLISYLAISVKPVVYSRIDEKKKEKKRTSFLTLIYTEKKIISKNQSYLWEKLL